MCFRLGPAPRFLSHTRFLFTLRSVDRPSLYHSLLLFRLSGLDSSSANAGEETDSDSPDSSTVTKDSIERYGQLYVMESTCPHLGAELSHADIEEGPDSAVAGS